MPAEFPLKFAVAQWSNTAALVAGLYTNDYEMIGRAVADHIAEPFRGALIPAFADVKATAYRNGALACSISGSGPSVFALTEGMKHAESIAKAMMKEFAKVKIKSRSFISGVNKRGARVMKS